MMTTEAAGTLTFTDLTIIRSFEPSATEDVERKEDRKLDLLKSSEPLSRTEPEIVRNDHLFEVVNRKDQTSQPRLTPSKSSSVSGAVIQFDKQSVLCEIYAKSGNTQVTIPYSLFPSKVHMGYTFKLALDSSGAFSKPVITEEERRASPSVQAKIDALISRLV